MIQKLYIYLMTSLFFKGLLFNGQNQSLGVVDTKHKKILDGSEYDPYIDSADSTSINILPNTTIEDSVQTAIKLTNQYQYQTSRLARLFKGRDILEQVYNFAYYHIRYKEDALMNEQIRKPARTWKDRKSGVDCDCFSVFIGSILKNLDIPFVFRIADYGNGWQHIYVVAYDDNNREIPIDPVIRKFNYEKPFIHRKDYWV